MKVLIACEESQEVCKAFRERGHEAFSCDLQDCSGGHPEWHIIGDVLETVNDGWDLMVAHPPCTYFSRAGIQFIHKQSGRMDKLKESFEFVKQLWNAKIKKIALENPAGWLCTNWKRPTQTIHPWYFGDNEMKETCLWLKGLPKLQGLVEVAMNKEKFHPVPEKSRVGSDGKMKNKYFMSRMTNAKDRSKTFPSIAKAMAQQWG
jgi:site-specific DNA-cytosine methylase